jgi:1,4-dihydroxy-2-naphthoyl-CoA hydrolase
MNTHYQRTIRFADVDGAGVVFFANYLAICHEAYEEQLLRAGIELGGYFRANQVAIPIAKTSAQYLAPLRSGDRVRVELAVTVTGESGFAIAYRVMLTGSSGDKLAALVKTEHVVVDLRTMERKALPSALAAWVQANGGTVP